MEAQTLKLTLWLVETKNGQWRIVDKTFNRDREWRHRVFSNEDKLLEVDVRVPLDHKIRKLIP
jgi:hypothetical protein